jgi:hypothetical protein
MEGKNTAAAGEAAVQSRPWDRVPDSWRGHRPNDSETPPAATEDCRSLRKKQTANNLEDGQGKVQARMA